MPAKKKQQRIPSKGAQHQDSPSKNTRGQREENVLVFLYNKFLKIQKKYKKNPKIQQMKDTIKRNTRNEIQ